MRRMRAISIFGALALLALAAQAHAVVVTNSSEDLRTGWYPSATTITPELVSGGTFGEMWSSPVEGQVYAQPLLANGHLLVATEDNKVYALDPTTGAEEWSESLGTPWNASDIGCGDLTPTIGVTSTPVIDTSTNTAYLTHKTYVSGHSGPARWYMDALNLTTGAEQSGFPVELSGKAQNAAGQTFAPTTDLQRPGLLLMEGVVYAAFGSECDTSPYLGWVFGVSTAGVVKARWAADATGDGAGIWQSGAGLTSDGAGTLLVSTGNGGAPTTPTPGATPPSNLGESIVRLRVQADGSLKATDFFAPFDAESLDTWDADFASGGVTGLPSEYFGTATIPNLAVAVGKDGYVYLLNRNSLGGIGQGPSGSDNVVQRIGPYGGVWSRPGVWPGEGGWVYIPTASGGSSSSGSSGNLMVYKYGKSGTGAPTLSLAGTSSDAFGFSSSAPIITSNGTESGSALVWVVWAPNGSGVGAQLRAYDPLPVGGHPVLRWSAPIGTSAKFATPGVGAGRLFVGTRDGHVIAFGSPVTPSLTGGSTVFPTTTVGSSSKKELTLTANEKLTITNLESSSPQFTIGTPSIPLPAELLPEQTIKIPITFSPTGTGPQAATLTATPETGKSASFALSGNGQSSGAQLETSPRVVSFLGTTVGERRAETATIRNVGSEPLEIEAIDQPSAPFEVEGLPAVHSQIGPSESITVTINFAPEAEGSFKGEIGLLTTGGESTIALAGSGGSRGTLQISSEANDYGGVRVGHDASKSFTITNVGGTPVEITKSKPPAGGAFAATTSLPEGTEIDVDETLTETVEFSPTATGPASGTWDINGNDSTGIVHEVRFTGEGTLPPVENPFVLPILGSGGPPSSETPQKIVTPIPNVKLTSSVFTTTQTGTLALKLSCPVGESKCTGTITLRTLTPVKIPGKRKAILTLAHGSFSLTGGKTVTVKLRLTAAARSLLVHGHSLRAAGTILARDSKGTKHTTHQTITLRAAKATGSKKG